MPMPMSMLKFLNGHLKHIHTNIKGKSLSWKWINLTKEINNFKYSNYAIVVWYCMNYIHRYCVYYTVYLALRNSCDIMDVDLNAVQHITHEGIIPFSYNNVKTWIIYLLLNINIEKLKTIIALQLLYSSWYSWYCQAKETFFNHFLNI